MLRALLSCLLVGFAVLAASCLKRGTRVAHGDREQILYRTAGGDIGDIDPHLSPGIAEGKIIATLFEPLVASDADSHPVPGLAERWDISPDGLTYTFHLRADARWSNGEPVTAADCLASWRRILTPSLGADYAYLFHVIAGAEDFHRGRHTDFSRVGLAAPDARTLVVTLARPVPYFLQLLPGTPWRPVNVRALSAWGDPFTRGTPWTRPGRLVSSGPFELAAWDLNHRIVVRRSATYWDRARVRLHEIHFMLAENEDTAERAFRGGRVHVTESLPPAKIDPYRREQPEVLRRDPYANTFFFRFNTRRAPLDDARLRRALSLAIDRQALADRVLVGGQQPAATFVPPQTPDYLAPERPLTDPAAARRLLAEAGYGPDRPVPPLTVAFANSNNFRLVAEAIQEMWRRELGLEVRLANREFKTLLDERRRGDYDILLSNWLGDYPDATSFLDLFRRDSGNNHTGWRDAVYDELLDQAAATPDLAARAALLGRAEALMLDAAPIAPLYFNTHVYLLQTSVKGWRPSLLDQLDYRQVYLEPAP